MSDFIDTSDFVDHPADTTALQPTEAELRQLDIECAINVFRSEHGIKPRHLNDDELIAWLRERETNSQHATDYEDKYDLDAFVPEYEDGPSNTAGGHEHWDW